MWTNFRALIGIFSQIVGPILAIWWRRGRQPAAHQGAAAAHAAHERDAVDWSAMRSGNGVRSVPVLCSLALHFRQDGYRGLHEPSSRARRVSSVQVSLLKSCTRRLLIFITCRGDAYGVEWHAGRWLCGPRPARLHAGLRRGDGCGFGGAQPAGLEARL